jgi:carbon-monoxide dehydrogenase small subunit
MKRSVLLKVNAEEYELFLDPRRTLLEVLRNDLGFTGTKEGCGEGACGACTVLLDGKAVNACLILAVEVSSREILTIEGLAKVDALHPLQQSFIDHWAIQCGFCTPGMVLSAKALLDRNPHPSENEIRRALAGNFCRCSGYSKIVKAITAASNLLKNFD